MMPHSMVDDTLLTYIFRPEGTKTNISNPAWQPKGRLKYSLFSRYNSKEREMLSVDQPISDHLHWTECIQSIPIYAVPSPGLQLPVCHFHHRPRGFASALPAIFFTESFVTRRKTSSQRVENWIDSRPCDSKTLSCIFKIKPKWNTLPYPSPLFLSTREMH